MVPMRARTSASAASCIASATISTVVVPGPTADSALCRLAQRRACEPLSWHRQRPGRPGLVLGYAASAPAEISDAIAIIGGHARHAG